MKSPYERRLNRARVLLNGDTDAADILTFYLEIASLQERIYDETDSAELASLLRWFPDLIHLLKRFAPAVAEFGEESLRDESARLDALAARWGGDSGEIDARADFFASALLQPFASKLASRGQVDPNWTHSSCPFCASPAGVVVLRGEGDGAKRSLLCSLCSIEWPFRRILCPNCGEEDKARLPVYVPAGLEHVRVEACDRCKTYIKSIDLTKNGLADPVVDEIATVSLNIWAEAQGYVKLTPNVMGM